MTDRSRELLAALKEFRCAGCDRRFFVESPDDASMCPLCGDNHLWPMLGLFHIASADASAEVSVPVDVAVKRIRHWLVQSFRYTAGTIELDEVLRREITAAVSASAAAEQKLSRQQGESFRTGSGKGVAERPQAEPGNSVAGIEGPPLLTRQAAPNQESGRRPRAVSPVDPGVMCGAKPVSPPRFVTCQLHANHRGHHDNGYVQWAKVCSCDSQDGPDPHCSYHEEPR